MQRTRLSTLFDTANNQLNRWLFNPWRRISIIVISLLGGNFFGVAIAAIAGQAAQQDVTIAIVLVILSELLNRLIYGRNWRRRGQPPEEPLTVPLFYESLNAFKIGTIYALILEAFKLGS
ncbi:MAG: DUF565 domain-containing protein [Cyanobacteria bacterium Co-bin13]|nr:DUF565 domain-containing protein [Cyanobacteria bacterium Co-bin13]